MANGRTAQYFSLEKTPPPRSARTPRAALLGQTAVRVAPTPPPAIARPQITEQRRRQPPYSWLVVIGTRDQYKTANIKYGHGAIVDFVKEWIQRCKKEHHKAFRNIHYRIGSVSFMSMELSSQGQFEGLLLHGASSLRRRATDHRLRKTAASVSTSGNVTVATKKNRRKRFRRFLYFYPFTCSCGGWR